MLKTILRRFGKGAAAYILASMASQVTPICDSLIYLIPHNVLATLNLVGVQATSLCTAGIGALILAGEKAINFNKGGTTNA